MRRAAVYGLGIAGQATAIAMSAKGIGVRVGDDDESENLQNFAESIDSPFTRVHDAKTLRAFLQNVEVLVPAPGVAPSHPVILAARAQRIAVRSEIDIAYEWEQDRVGGTRPILAVTGTDGKTTTTMLAAALIRGSGKRVAEVGNTDLPFIAALEQNIDVFVVECSSFRLEFTQMFRASASVWLNLAPDHLDWHENLENYMAAKQKIWAHSNVGDVAIIPVENEMIREAARASGLRTVTFGLTDADYCVKDGVLVGPQGSLCDVSNLWRALPHDITNALAACALVLESGVVDRATLASSLSSFVLAHHRIELVTTNEGVCWYDDSKATSPHAALTAIKGFESIVLIAGGRNKDLDLTLLASEPGRMRGVVAIGEDAALVEDAFQGICEIRSAQTMKQAVEQAASMAKSGDAVLLSPACTSYDWYANYNERGDDFQKCVRDLCGDQSINQGSRK